MKLNAFLTTAALCAALAASQCNNPGAAVEENERAAAVNESTEPEDPAVEAAGHPCTCAKAKEEKHDCAHGKEKSEPCDCTGGSEEHDCPHASRESGHDCPHHR